MVVAYMPLSRNVLESREDLLRGLSFFPPNSQNANKIDLTPILLLRVEEEGITPFVLSQEPKIEFVILS